MTKKSTATTITPYLCCRNGVAALDFYKKAFGAVEAMRMAMPDGKLGHGEFSINGVPLMLADEFPEHGHVSPQTLNGSPVTIAIVVPDVDAFVARAVAAGAKLSRPVENMFYGHRSGQLTDPFGHRWDISTVVEELTHEEINKRAAAMFGSK